MSEPKPGTPAWDALLDQSDAEVTDIGREYRRRVEANRPLPGGKTGGAR